VLSKIGLARGDNNIRLGLYILATEPEYTHHRLPAIIDYKQAVYAFSDETIGEIECGYETDIVITALAAAGCRSADECLLHMHIDQHIARS
jgi:hypothetical protein